MDYITKKIGNAEFTFLVNSRSNRSGFVHECVLCLNGNEIAREKTQYYNRTWEAYRFQSVMLGAVSNALNEVKQRISDDMKQRNGWKLLSEARKNEVRKAWEQNTGIKTLEALAEDVRKSRYGTETERKELESLDLMIAVLEILMDKTPSPAQA